MGLLDSVIGAFGQTQGGAQGTQGGPGDLLHAVIGMLGQDGGNGLGGLGGLSGLVDKFHQGGLGDIVNSWIGNGHNLPVSPAQISQVLGSDTVAQLASRFGLGHAEVAGQLSQLLPQLVDKLTPNGQLPQGGLPGMGDIAGMLGGLMRR